MEKPTNLKTITVEINIQAPLEKVWEFWTVPEHIVKWCYASDDWEAPHAENETRVGGKFKTVMAAKDKSTSFNFTGVYTAIKEHELIEYDIDDGRHVAVQFVALLDSIKVIETFEIENINPESVQRTGWQAILDNFKKHVESS